MISLEQNVEQVNVEDLTEAPIQRSSLKKVFFKERSILKTTCMYVHFLKKVADGKPAA